MSVVPRCPLQEERRGEDLGEWDSQQTLYRFPSLASKGLADAFIWAEKEMSFGKQLHKSHPYKIKQIVASGAEFAQ